MIIIVISIIIIIIIIRIMIINAVRYEYDNYKSRADRIMTICKRVNTVL